METRSWVTTDKSSWGNGPWQSEPDKLQWSDPATGYPCLIHRSEVTGALCGYVGVSEGHPMYKNGGEDADLEVHGGITYEGMCDVDADPSTGICHYDPGSPPVYWLGFDCSHAGDLSPAMEARLREAGYEPPPLTFHDLKRSWRVEVYRDLAYVEEQCTLLAEQLKAVENEQNQNQNSEVQDGRTD